MQFIEKEALHRELIRAYRSPYLYTERENELINKAFDAVINAPEVEREPEAAPAFYQETEALILFLKSAANRLAVSGNVNQEVQAVIHDLLYKANSLKNQQRMIRRAYEREEKHAPDLGTHHGADDV